jgi:hypothetical protein
MTYTPLNVNGQATMANSAPVVVSSDQSTLPVSQLAATVPASTTLQNAAGATGNGTSLNVSGYAVAILSVTGTFSATLTFEVSLDDSTWVSILAHQVGVSGSLGTTATTTGDYRINVAGYKSVRARVSAFTSGAVTVKGYSTPLAGHPTTVSLASGGVVQLTDGTQIANTLAGDTGQNAALVAGTRKEISFTTTTAQAVGTTDVSNYRWVGVQINSQGGSSTVTFQGSNDNTNWSSVTLADLTNNTNAGGASTTAASAKIWHGPLSFRYFRLNVTGIVSGTTAGVIEFFSVPGVTHSLGAVAVQSGTWTVQPGNTANTTAWLTTDRGTTATTSQPATSTTVATLQASNAARKELVIVNNAGVVLYVKYGSTATTTDWTHAVAAGGTHICDKYTGIVTGILASGSASTANVTEVA